MAQHDGDIANQLFPDFRIDLNSLALALMTSNSGPALPAITYACMIAFNTTDDTVYMRNKANTAWVALGKIISDKFYPFIDGAQLIQGTTAVKGIWEAADGTESAALASALLCLTPLGLASVLCTETALGLARYGTTAEMDTATAADRAVSVLQLARRWKEGAAIASAATLVKPSDANRGGVYSLTGAVTVTALWSGETAGTVVKLRLAGAPQFTNSANLIIPGGTRTFAAGDVLEFTAEASNVWRLTDALLANGKALVESQPTAVFTPQLVIIEDQKANGTAGQGLASGAMRKRNLNTLVVNDAGIAAPVSDQFVLGAGTWEIEWATPACQVDQFVSQLQNVTDGLVYPGSSMRSGSADYNLVSTGYVKVVLAGSKTFQVNTQVAFTNNTNGGGFPHSLGSLVEVYSRVVARRVA